MAKGRKDRNNADRHLTLRGGVYQYRRRVPSDIAHLDKRAPIIRMSLKTDDLVKARAMRDMLEQADNELWASLVVGKEVDPWEKHQAILRLARATGLHYKPLHEVQSMPDHLVAERLVNARAVGQPALAVQVALGAPKEPTVTVREAFETYLEKIAGPQLLTKSPGQRRRWETIKRASIESFIEVVGNIDIREITRVHARQYYDYWVARVAPKEGKPTHTADIGNRRLGDLAGLYKDYFSYMEEGDRPNPFDRLRFKRKSMKSRKRPPFSHEWIVNTLLKPGALAGLNDQARGIFLVCANTGARPSEVANLVPERIVLNHEVPHILIEPDEDPDAPIEIKTTSSIRALPLVGMSLDVMRKFPKGFGRYYDNASSLSATINKYLRENKLRETPAHSVYSLRHSFEDRMKNAKIDSEIRRILMGHSIDRPDYGEGGSLKLRQEAMQLVALPYDPSIV